MVKKRRPATRRSTQRGRKQDTEEGNATDNEPPPSASASPSLQTGHNGSPSPSVTHTSIDIDAIKASDFPIVALHKKFGKYRCLSENLKKYEVGSDSESSSLDTKVVDPCIGSESDSNTASETLTNEVNCTKSCTPLSSCNETITDTPLDLPIPLAIESIEPVENKSPSIDLEQQMNNETTESPVTAIENVPEINPNIPTKSGVENVNDDNDDDEEVITVVQIVEDGDDSMEMTFDINIDSPKASSVVIENRESTLEISKGSIGDFPEHFDKLNINTTPIISLIDSPDLNNSSNNESCLTPELSMNKELDALNRPDPSLTPSSTISDDSNSSRILTDANQCHSNDSAESSPSGVRRSTRIKTISTLKQKTKGYGLVKTPLKKVLLTQAKMKLEEAGSDSSDKISDLPSSVSNSPSFTVPSEMPVKVKSRWRRSSELEMNSNSPTVSPLASPGLPRLPPVSELKDEPLSDSVTSKEDCEQIINDRMKQFQHLDENMYMCDRMISKDAKKMICDCFLTKEEIERGELGCGEDCLNRLLMIEW